MNLFFWKHKEKPEVIKQECYDKLPPHRQVNYIPTKEQPTHYVDRVDRSASSGDDGFITSAIIGYATNSTMLGTLGGGNLAGAFVGEMVVLKHQMITHLMTMINRQMMIMIHQTMMIVHPHQVMIK